MEIKETSPVYNAVSKETESVAKPVSAVAGETKPVDYRSKRVNYALAAMLVAQGMDWEEIAPRVGAKNGKSLRVGISRKGVTKTAAQAVSVVTETTIARKEAATARTVTEAAEIIREKAAKRLESQLDVLAALPVGELASKGQGEASVLKTIAETHRTLFGGSDQINIVFGVSSLSGDGAQPQPIVVDAEIVPDQEAPS